MKASRKMRSQPRTCWSNDRSGSLKNMEDFLIPGNYSSTSMLTIAGDLDPVMLSVALWVLWSDALWQVGTT